MTEVQAREFVITHFNNMNPQALATVLPARKEGDTRSDIERAEAWAKDANPSVIIEFANELKAQLEANEFSAPWMVSIVKQIISLSKPVFISLLYYEASKKENADDLELIHDIIKDLEDEKSDYWENELVPHIKKTKKWDDTAPGNTSEALARMGLSTQRGVSKATNWTGDQLVKLGNIMKRNAEATGKAAASPIMGLAKLTAKKPGEPEPTRIK